MMERNFYKVNVEPLHANFGVRASSYGGILITEDGVLFEEYCLKGLIESIEISEGAPIIDRVSISAYTVTGDGCCNWKSTFTCRGYGELKSYVESVVRE